MSSQLQSAGRVTEEVELRGKKYTLHTPPVMDLFAGLETEVMKTRGDVFAVATEACKVAPPAMHGAIWDAALRQKTREGKPSQAEIERFVNSIQGVAYVLWRCLQANHAAEFPAVESVLAIVQDLAEAKLTEVMLKTKVVTGEAEAKN